MAAITAKADRKMQSLADAASSGQLGADVARFIRLSINGIYAAPGNFIDEADMLHHLRTLSYLVDLHVYKK